MSAHTPDEVLEFWFGPLDARGRVDQRQMDRWWRKDPSFDAEIRRRFLATHRAVVERQCESWLTNPRGRLAYVIVLDQFSRNMFRDTAEMFAFDARALAVARGGLAAGHDREFGPDQRSFFYLPFMHSEDLADQKQCVALYQALCEEVGGADRERVQYSLSFAIKHHDIVARFGRFPHRNALLGRTSTAEEKEFLTQPDSSF